MSYRAAMFVTVIHTAVLLPSVLQLEEVMQFAVQ